MNARLKFFLVLFLSGISLLLSAQDITVDKLKANVYFLASDSLKGRKTGTPEGFIAATYIRDQLKSDGLELFGENGFQFFEVVSGAELGKNNHFKIEGYNDVTAGKDFKPFPFSRNASISAKVVFTGYGFDISEDSLKWNDYNGVDVKGKWVIILRGDPEMDNNESPFTRFSSARAKVLTAKDKGAAGVLFITPLKMDDKDELISLTFDKSPSDAGIPVIHITRALADTILSKVGKSIEQVEKTIDDNKQPQSFDIPVEVHAQTDVLLIKSRAQNVVAMLMGKDPVIKDQYIVIGAHYDHLGMGGPESGSRALDTIAVHNGADDNASGVAGMLGLAEKLSRNGEMLKRSILFIAFDGEEMGLLGSKYFINNPLIDIKKIIAMFNFDMIGRLKPDSGAVVIGGTGTAAETEDILKRHSSELNFKVKYSPEGFGASDHSSFYAVNTPVFFFTTGAHEDYHTPFDDADRINYKGSKEVLDFAYNVILEVDNLDQPLTFREAGPKERPEYGRGFKVTLGIMPDFASTENNGLRVDGVRKGGPADKGGIQKGDVITALNGKGITNIYDYMNRLKELDHGQTISVDVLRNGIKVVLIIQL